VTEEIIDMHQHLDEVNRADVLAAEYGTLGIAKAVLLARPPSRVPGSNRAVLEAARKYPKLFIPFVGFDLDDMKPDDLVRFQNEGFVGIKFIAPKKPYNDPSYFPVYETAADLGMPAVFHLGIVANYRPWTDCDSNLMRPIHLDHIARCFPSFRIVGAHLGNPWYEEAAMACRWNPNLFFDLSGSTLKKKTPEFIRGLLWWTPDSFYKSPDRTHAWQKIVFGTDVPHSEVEDVMRDYQKLMESLNLSPELREAVWYRNAAKVLGLT